MINSKNNSRIEKGKQTKLTWGECVCQHPHEKGEATGHKVLFFGDEVYEENRNQVDIQPFNAYKMVYASP